MKFRYLILVLSLFGSGMLNAADYLPAAEAGRVLERIARAPLQVAFQGVYVFQQGEQRENIHICRVIEDGVIHERREALDGSPREMVRNGDSISLFITKGGAPASFDPRSNDRLFPRLLADNLPDVLANYHLRKGARARVAGVDAEVYELEPKDRWRYPHRFWVHPDSGLLLKAVTLGAKRETLELYAFSQLTLGAQVDRSLLKPVNPVKPVAIDSGSTPVSGAVRWEAKDIPAGFRLIRQSQRTLPGGNRRVLQYLYGDGVVTVSVFLESVQPGAPVGVVRQGVLSGFGRIDGAYHIMAIGKVPPETSEQFAKAYKPIEKQAGK